MAENRASRTAVKITLISNSTSLALLLASYPSPHSHRTGSHHSRATQYLRISKFTAHLPRSYCLGRYFLSHHGIMVIVQSHAALSSEVSNATHPFLSFDAQPSSQDPLGQFTASCFYESCLSKTKRLQSQARIPHWQQHFGFR